MNRADVLTPRFTLVMVLLKLAALVYFVAVGIRFFDLRNWFPPGVPSGWSGFAPNGIDGVLTGAAIVFFAYIGFDAVSTAAEETRDPPRDLPVGILGSLGICTVVYVVVAAVLTGMVPWTELDTAEPLAAALAVKGGPGPAAVVALGSLFAHTAVLLVFQLGQPRIFFAMSRDGLLPAWCARVHPRHRTPHVATILTGVLVAGFAAVFPVSEIVDLTNIGTLFAFLLVAVGVLVLRFLEPNRPRPFRTPVVWLTAPAAAGVCVTLMAYLPAITWIRFGLWLLAGLAIYFCCIVGREALEERGIPPRNARAVAAIAASLLVAAVIAGAIRLAR